MGISVQHNMAMMAMYDNLKIVTNSKGKITEKLASGYRVNRAADDAASLAISEKMRTQIRGLHQGTQNAQDGLSWVQVGDGSLNEASDMLHRMNELTVKSLNETLTATDRAYLEAEFEQLQSELDRLTKTTTFNEKNIFSEHEPDFYKFGGGVNWDYSQLHTIRNNSNKLSFDYYETKDGALQTATVSVPAGTYTTQELIDELDTALEKAGLKDKGFNLEMTPTGICNINFEGGYKIENVNDSLSYLFTRKYQGGSMGALLGTTIFPSESSKLTISSENNNLEFTIEDVDGNEITKDLTLPSGSYTRQQIIDKLNESLSDTTVRAEAFGTGIKLASDDAIITGFKGNMFKIDTGDRVYSSVFYDNVKFGEVQLYPSTVTGGALLTSDTRDAEHGVFHITSTNNKLSFKPDGATTATEITIPDGEYTATQMASKLNELFTAEGLGLKASSFKNSDNYSGIKIETTSKGTAANVGIDKTSSAYKTLFTDRVTNSFANTLTETSRTGNSLPYVYSIRGISYSHPLTIDSMNNTFKLTLTAGDGSVTDYAVSIPVDTPPHEYRFNDSTDRTKLTNAIKEGLAHAHKIVSGTAVTEESDLSSLVSANTVNKTVANLTSSYTPELIAVEGSGIRKISVDSFGNNGYMDIFCDYQVSNKTASNSGTSSRPATITTNGDIPDSVSFTSSNNVLYVYEDGTNSENLRTVSFSTGQTYTRAEILDKLNADLAADTKEKNFGTVTVSGSYNAVSGTAVKGTTTNSTRTGYSVIGVTEEAQGEVGKIIKDEPAKLTLSQPLNSTTHINNSNDSFTLTINGVTKTLSLVQGKYKQNELISELQSKIDAAFGTGFGGAAVSLSADKKIVMTARTNKSGGAKAYGRDTSISCNISGNEFMTYVEAQKTSATTTPNGSYAAKSSITLHDDSNKFTFRLQTPDDTTLQNKTIELAAGTYTRTSFINAMNEKLKAYEVTASLDSSNRLVLTTDNKGKEYSIAYSYSTNPGNSNFFADAFEGAETGSSSISGYTMPSAITIDDATNKLNIRSYSTDASAYQDNIITLDNGTYTRSNFASMLNSKLSANGINAQVSVSSSGILTLRTTLPGSNRRVQMEYSDPESTAISAMYPPVSREGITASFEESGGKHYLKLTRNSNGGSLRVTSNDHGSIFEVKEIGASQLPKSTDSTSATTHSITGHALTYPLTIDKYNCDLSFKQYYPYNESNSTSRSISVSLEKKQYNSASELVYELQSKIDANTGSGNRKVEVDYDHTTGAIILRPTTPGSRSYLERTSFSGSFADRILNTATPVTATQTVSSAKGSQKVDSAFTVGRKDIRNEKVKIKASVNDELKLDYNVNGTKTTLEMKLSPGDYNGESLVAEINKQLKKALTDAGLNPELIKAQIGGVSTGVYGSNDSNALVFTLNNKLNMGEEGEYILDGVSGNAAFSIFYKTDGEIGVAYAEGAKKLDEDITIDDTNNTLNFEYDHNPVSVTIPSGKYTPKKLAETINTELGNQHSLVHASIENGRLKLYTEKFGKHPIDKVTGSMANDVFYDCEGAEGKQEDIRIKVSGQLGDHIDIERRRMGTAYLNINTCTISQTKYANKALDRIKEALNLVSETRSYFGSIQNRIEHTINSNNNKEENTQASESVIRDADMAKLAVEQAQIAIVEQFGTSLLANQKQQAQNVLSLLQ